MNLLFIDQNYGESNIGGAFKSNYSLINQLTKDPEFNILILARYTKNIKNKNLKAKRIRFKIAFRIKKVDNLISFLKINQYFSFFPILREISRFKPDVIITQRDLTLSAVLTGLIKRIPVINVVRDAMEFCPKNIDIINLNKNCDRKISRKECWSCINKWRSLRVALKDRPPGWEHSIASSLFTMYYKMRYFLTKFYIFIIRHTNLIIVASPLMKDLLKKKSRSMHILVRKITPIDQFNIKSTSEGLNKDIIQKIESSKTNILFVIPRHEGGSKGYPFIKRLIEYLPQHYNMIIVGTVLNELTKYKNVINIDKVPTPNLYYLYRKSKITLVPSIYSEAFGRVIIESILNKTPVIISPQCGAGYLFYNKKYVSILPLKIDLWINEITNMLSNPPEIKEEEIKLLEKMFSPEECANDLINLIKKIRKK